MRVPSDDRIGLHLSDSARCTCISMRSITSDNMAIDVFTISKVRTVRLEALDGARLSGNNRTGVEH